MLQSVHLKNICQHADTSLDLGPGLTVVVGPQGSGKTNLFLMPLASVMGESPLYGLKQANIRRGAEDEQAYVKTVWSVGGKQIELIRSFNKCRSSLAIDGVIDETQRRETEVTQATLTALQIEKDSIWDFCFVPQGQTDGLLQAGGTDRVKFMARFLDQGWLLDIEAKVKAAQATAKGLLGRDYMADLTEHWIGNRRTSAEAVVVKGEEEGKLRGLEVLEQQLEGLADEAARVTILLDKQQRLSIAVTKRMDAVARVTAEELALVNGPQRVQALREQVATAEALEAAAKGNEEYRRVTAELSQTVALLATAERLLNEAPPVMAGHTEFTLEKAVAAQAALQIEVSEMAARLREANQQVVWTQKGRRICSECGTQVDATPEQHQAAVNAATNLGGLLRNLQADQQTLQTYIQATRTYMAGRPAIEQRVSQLRQAEAGLRLNLLMAAAYTELPVGYTRLTASQMQAMRTQLEREAVYAGQADLRLSHAKESLAAAEAEITSLEMEVAKLSEGTDVAVAERYMQVKQARQAAMADLQAVQVRRTQLLTRSQGHKEQVKRLLGEVRQQRTVLRAQRLLDQLAIHVRPKEIPVDVLAGMLRGIALRMSQLCEELGQPFDVTVGDDLDFMIRHSDGGVEPARRLSHGQRACVSTVFWLVRLTANVAGSLPLLVLDEPTANMDAAAVAKFGEMLKNLGPMLVARGLQVVLITHHEQLLGCGQYTVRLGA